MIKSLDLSIYENGCVCDNLNVQSNNGQLNLNEKSKVNDINVKGPRTNPMELCPRLNFLKFCTEVGFSMLIKSLHGHNSLKSNPALLRPPEAPTVNIKRISA